MIALVSGQLAQWGRIATDARRHKSPNAGWPEAAMAGALAVRLSGPRIYGTHKTDEPWLNGAARDPVRADLQAGLALYQRTLLLGGLNVAEGIDDLAWWDGLVQVHTDDVDAGGITVQCGLDQFLGPLCGGGPVTVQKWRKRRSGHDFTHCRF